MTRIIIKNGTIIDPGNGREEKSDLLLENGLVKSIGGKAPAKGAQVIEAKGMMVCPGLIDMHVHLREPGDEHKETIRSGTSAAAAGGVTSLACMPNTQPALDNAGMVDFVLSKAKLEGVVNVFPVAAITKERQGKELTEIGGLKRVGVGAISDDGDGVMDAGLQRRALQYARMFDMPILTHAEDKNLSGSGVMHEGYWSTRLGLAGIPAAAEEVMVARDIILAEETGGILHISHASTAGTIELVRQAKKRGLASLTCETAPHYFSLDDSSLESYDTNYKMSPPLRSADDVKAIIAGIADGTVDAIATDHAPHSINDKAVEFDNAAKGIIGLETMLGLANSILVEQAKIPLAKVLSLMTVNPAAILRLKKGNLAPGQDADVMIFDPREAWTVDAGEFHGKSVNSPFIGMKLRGRVKHTVCGGKLVYSNGEVLV